MPNPIPIDPPAPIVGAGGLAYQNKVVGDVTDIKLPHGIYKLHREIIPIVGAPESVGFGALIRIVVDNFYYNIVINSPQNEIHLSSYHRGVWSPWKVL